MSLDERLAACTASSCSMEWQPQCFQLRISSQREEVERLLASGQVTRVVDTISDQLTDWLKASQPARTWTRDELTTAASELLENSAAEFGNWFFFPWSRVLCHVLPEPEFRFLRTVRNRHKISLAEQDLLAAKTIAIVGLSVGLFIATTLALEGIGRRFRLADFDALGLSNLNRLRASVSDLGTNKAILAARQLFELDPYLEIEIFPVGVTTENVASFLAARLDLLIEECDDLRMKVRLREEARRRRIPVMMDTSDRGLLDVERFDREPDRPLLHGLFGDLQADDLQDMIAADKVPIALRILNPRRLTLGMRASLPEIGHTIETWPQLASAVALGGGITADAARRLLLGEFTESGRYYVDAAEIVRDGAGSEIELPIEHKVRTPQTPTVRRPTRLNNSGLSRHEAEFLIEHAILAPSGGNSQPWRFEMNGSELWGYIVPERTQQLIDFEFRGCYTALGAAAENISLAAGELGLAAEIDACPDSASPHWAFRTRFRRTPSTAPDPELFVQIPLRVTNRKTGLRSQLPPHTREQRSAAAAKHGGQVLLLQDSADLDSIGDLMGRCDRTLLLTEAGHRETFGELRFNPNDVVRTRDGLDVDSLEVSAAGRAALGILSDWSVMRRVREVGGGSALEDLAKQAVAGSMAVGLLRIPGKTSPDFVRGGRALQRLWLTATRLELTFHPWTALPYLLARTEQKRCDAMTTEESDWFNSLRGEYQRLFPSNRESADVLLFRLGWASVPTARSLRRPMKEVFTVRTSW